MSETLHLSDIRVVDIDSHVTEPPDLWTSRVAKKFGDRIPRVEWNEDAQANCWRIGDHWSFPVGYSSHAGWKEYPPSGPSELEDADPASYDPNERIKRMDEYGIYAQVLYPNMLAFEAGRFMALGAEESLACTQAYNDFIVEFAGRDLKRLIPLAMMPFWDVEASIREMERAKRIGHRGILFGNRYELMDLPPFFTQHWDPIYAAAQDLDLSINFHVGVAEAKDGMFAKQAEVLGSVNDPRLFAMGILSTMLSHVGSIASILCTGLCDRFPRLKFVSVESGFGYIPYLLDNLDWHWKGYGAHVKHSMLPSEYFRRQCYGSLWFEQSTLPLLELFPDNFMFETDFPHPTGLSPGPASPADLPSVHIANGFTDVVPADVARKVLYENAANVYQLD